MNQDDAIREILEREFSVSVTKVWTERNTGETTCATFEIRKGQFTVCADWGTDSTVESVAEDIAAQSRMHTARGA